MKTQWIDVKDSLPTNFDPVKVLIYGKKESFAIHVLDWHFYSKSSFTLIRELPNEQIVTHWMKL